MPLDDNNQKSLHSSSQFHTESNSLPYNIMPSPHQQFAKEMEKISMTVHEICQEQHPETMIFNFCTRA
uniref:Uncharacterized protein n=1 Tax=Romanomermis culicivorax TaxID=13658 RepID=A0A915JYL5_ROMCU